MSQSGGDHQGDSIDISVRDRSVAATLRSGAEVSVRLFGPRQKCRCDTPLRGRSVAASLGSETEVSPRHFAPRQKATLRSEAESIPASLRQKVSLRHSEAEVVYKHTRGTLVTQQIKKKNKKIRKQALRTSC